MLWNNVLTVVTLGNAAAAAYLFLLRPMADKVGQRGEDVPGKKLYATAAAAEAGRQLPPGAGRPALLLQLWDFRPLLACLYVLGCGIRAIWPRFDGACVKVCSVPECIVLCPHVDPSRIVACPMDLA